MWVWTNPSAVNVFFITYSSPFLWCFHFSAKTRPRFVRISHGSFFGFSLSVESLGAIQDCAHQADSSAQNTSNCDLLSLICKLGTYFKFWGTCQAQTPSSQWVNPTSSRTIWLLHHDATTATLTKHHKDATYHVHHKLICMCGTPGTTAQWEKPSSPQITHLNHVQPWLNYTTGHPHQNTHQNNLSENLTMLGKTAWILQSWLHTAICMCYPLCGCPCQEILYLKTEWLVLKLYNNNVYPLGESLCCQKLRIWAILKSHCHMFVICVIFSHTLRHLVINNVCMSSQFVEHIVTVVYSQIAYLQLPNNATATKSHHQDLQF